MDILDNQILGNSILEYIFTIAIFIGFIFLFQIIQLIALKRLKKIAERTSTDIDDTFIEIFKSLKPPFYFFLAIYLSIQFLTTSLFIDRVVNTLLLIWVIYQVIIASQILVDFILRKRLNKEKGKESQTAIKTFSKIIKGVIWAIGALFLLSNLGINITSLVAGLGVGGIAIAFALQNILTDLFSSFAILFDKPFIIGDFIVVGDKAGVVEKIGIKTTRIKSLHGEEIIISNRELTSSQIQNYKKMKERRVLFNFGVTYDTSSEKLKKIPGIVKTIIEKKDKVRFDRAHFKQFDDSQLTFEIVYYMGSSSYNDYMDANQSIHLAVKEAFEKEKIEMAFPTRTVHLIK